MLSDELAAARQRAVRGSSEDAGRRATGSQRPASLRMLQSPTPGAPPRRPPAVTVGSASIRAAVRPQQSSLKWMDYLHATSRVQESTARQARELVEEGVVLRGHVRDGRTTPALRSLLRGVLHRTQAS